jgi:tetratricopeptide (TPR) repeat protein
MTPKLAVRSTDIESPDQFAPALASLAAGDLKIGYTLLTEAHDRYPDDPRGANFLGMFLYDNNRIAEAVALFARAAARAKGVSAYAYNEGAALLMSGRSREAAVAFYRSLNGDTVLPAAHCWTWTAFYNLGIANDMIRRLREALHGDPAQVDCETSPHRVDLPSTTLCAIDCVTPDLAVRSMRRSMAQCRFGAVKLLTSRACRYEGIETIPINPIKSIEEYSRFVMKSLSQYVDTQFALVTQWDGYVINAGAWSDEFLAFDYVGARWPEDVVENMGYPAAYNVGNGGFSLRSDIFLGAGTDPHLAKTHPEDTHMCCTYRPYLEGAYGIRYGDAAIADRFSFEILEPSGRPFGFHGCFNLCCFEPDPKWMRFEFLGPDAFSA